MDVPNLGGKIGPRIAELVSQTLLSHKVQSADFSATLARHIADEILQVFSASLGTSHHNLTAALIDHPDISDRARAILTEMHGTPVGLEIATKLMDIFGAMGAAGQIGLNDLLPGVYGFIRAQPNKALDATTAADCAVRGIITEASAINIAGSNGHALTNFQAMQLLAEAQPGAAEVIALVRRGAISGAQGHHYLRRQGYTEDTANNLMALKDQLLSPDVLADAVTKGWMDSLAAATEAEAQGVNNERFGFLLDITGEPPGLMQLLEAYRRNLIDRPRLEKGIRESRVRNEWIDVVEGLRYMPPGPATCIEGAVKGHLTPAESKAKAEEAGLKPDEWQWMYETTGNPPGAMEMLHLLNRGEIDEARVIEGLKQGHLANTFIPDVLKLRRRLPETAEILLLQQAGVYSKADTVPRLRALGYDPADAAAIAAGGSRSKIQGDWTEAKTLVSDQYQIGILNRSQAVGALLGIGFEQDEADSICTVVELKRVAAQQGAVITKLRSLYVGRHIGPATCRTDLLSLRIPGDQVDEILNLWSLEREANVKILTEAQIVSAYKLQIIDEATATASLEGIGYQPHDAWVLLSIAAKGPLPTEPAFTATS